MDKTKEAKTAEELRCALEQVFDDARMEDWDGTTRFQMEFSNTLDALIASVREDCAKVCEDMYDTCIMAATAEKKSEYQVMASACAECAEAIRNLKGGS